MINIFFSSPNRCLPPMTPPVRLFLVDRLVGSLPFGNNFVKKLEVTLTCNEGRIQGGGQRGHVPLP